MRRKATGQTACTQEDGSACNCNTFLYAADRYLLCQTRDCAMLLPILQLFVWHLIVTCLIAWCSASLRVPSRALQPHSIGHKVSLQLSLTLSLAGEPARAEPASSPEQGASYIKAAAAGRRLPPAQILSAILALEKAKLPVRCCFKRVVYIVHHPLASC